MSRMSLRGQGRGLAVRVAIAVAAASLGLAGCQANPEPPPLEDAASTPSPSATPSPAAPSMPPEAKGTSRAAAKAFVRHYIDLVNYAASVGTTTTLEPLGTDGCESCIAIRKNISKVYASGGEIRGGRWTLKGVRVVHATTRSAVLSLDIWIEQEAVIASAGAKPKHHRAVKQPMTIFLTSVSGKWKVTRLDLVL